MSQPIDIKSLQRVKSATKNQSGPGDAATAPPGFMKRLETVLSKDISLSSPFSNKVKETFYLELGSLMGAGLDIRSCLQLVADEQRKKNAKQILTEVLEKVTLGKSLSTALKENKNFTPYEYHTIAIGEETGRLPIVLKQLSTYYKARIKQRRQIIGALTYPIIVLSIAFLAITFMLNFVVPMFADIFKRSGGELPWLTRKVQELSDFMRAWSGRIVLGIVLFVTFCYYNRNKLWYIKYKDTLLSKTPLVKDILSRIYLARFSSTMQLLLGAKVQLVQGLALCKEVMGYYPLEQALQHMETDVMKGATLHKAMSAYKVFPSKMVALVKAGEEVNQLELFFQNLAERYSEELDYQTSQLSKFMEPAIIVVLGIVVGLVLVAMYLPMFDIGNQIR